MRMSDLIAPARVISPLQVSGKKQLIEKIADIVSQSIPFDSQTIFDLLLEREKLGSTGVGGGIAIPHGKLSGLDQLYGFFLRLDKAVDYESMDENPVDLVFVLIAPDNAGGDHLQGLALIARKLRDDTICRRLRRTKEAKVLYRLLTEEVKPPPIKKEA